MAQDTRAGTQSPGSRDVIEDAIIRLRQGGMRSTPARRFLLAALLAKPGHRSAEELAADVHASAPDVHLATIYRNLDELQRLKIVDRTHLGHGPATYHLAISRPRHLIADAAARSPKSPARCSLS